MCTILKDLGVNLYEKKNEFLKENIAKTKSKVDLTMVRYI